MTRHFICDLIILGVIICVVYIQCSSIGSNTAYILQNRVFTYENSKRINTLLDSVIAINERELGDIKFTYRTDTILSPYIRSATEYINAMEAINAVEGVDETD